MTIKDLQKKYLSPSVGQCLAPEDFFVLLARATDKDKTFLLAHPEYELDALTEAKARDSFARRLKHEPVAYITGRKEFYGRDFLVTPDTLIPRPETEHLVESVLKHVSTISQQSTVNSQRKISIADIGTGSGNIIITIASELARKNLQSAICNLQFTFCATDISSGALETARENTTRHELTDIISFHEGSLLEPIIGELTKADEVIIAANLPYLSKEIYQASHDDVRLFEPETALVSEAAGLDHYYRLLDQAVTLSKPVTLFLEISPEQTPIITNYLSERFPQTSTQIHQDLSGRDRVVEIQIV